MMKKKLTGHTAKSVKNFLDKTLKVDANSASCAVIYQPKAPKELERFRKDR